jgi:O-antigen/teichoic acid export membrane protein
MSLLERMQGQLARATQGKQGRDVLWNLGSLLVLSACGFALVALLTRWYGDSGLGVFEQVYAAYVLFSQLAVGGIDRSVLRQVASHPGRDRELGAIVASALLPAVPAAALSTLLFWVGRDALAALVDSPAVAVGIGAAAPGLFCFAINKVLLGVVNGLSRMRAFAVYQSLRYVLILVGLLCVHELGWDGARAAFVFTFSEVLLLLVLIVELLRTVPLPRRLPLVGRAREHARYGAKSVASGMLLELQARVDVWMIGLFLSDARVGIYGIAARVGEGLFQILVVLQNVYNPRLAALFVGGKQQELERLARADRPRMRLGMLAAALVALAAYPLVLRIIAPEPQFAQSLLPFALLAAGMVAVAGHYPFAQALLMAGFPGWHTLYMLSIVAFNVVANSLLIPVLDISGAALATAGSLAFSAFALVALVRARTGVRL